MAADGAMAATTTDRAPSGAAPEGAAPPVRARRAGPAGLMLWSLAGFFALLAVLAVQVRAGEDPALGAAETPAAAAPARRVVVHRVVLRRVVVTDPAPRRSVASGGPAPRGGTAPAAPAPVAAAPAPPPAPVTTGSS